MAKKNSLLNDLIRAPWWVSIILACIALSFGGCPLTNTSSNVGNMLVINSVKALAPILSILFIFAALFSFIRAFKTRAQLKSQISIDTLNELSWKNFENVTGELYRQRGYRVEESLGGGADGGVDLRLRKDGQLTLVQCKRWKKKKVGLPVVRELLGAMTAESANKGMLITTSTFTHDAIRFAEQQGIQLINGTQLMKEINKLRSTPPVEAKTSSPPPISSVVSAAPTTPPNEHSPKCPKCATIMTLRTAKKGSNPGKKFWGCPGFPKCRGTRAYEE